MSSTAIRSELVEQLGGPFYIRAAHANGRLARLLADRGNPADKELAGRLRLVQRYLDLSRAALIAVEADRQLRCSCGVEATRWSAEDSGRVRFYCEAHAREAGWGHNRPRRLTSNDELQRLRHWQELIGKDDEPRFTESLYGITGNLQRRASWERWKVWVALRDRGGDARELAEPLSEIVDSYLKVVHLALIHCAKEGRCCCNRDGCLNTPTLWCEYSDRDSDYIEFWCDEHADELLAHPHAASYRWRGMRRFDGVPR